LLFLSGAAGLAYEVCWSRTLGLWIGRGERGAALTVTLFFVGMALGYGLAGRRSARSSRPLLGYAACEAVVGLWGFGIPRFASLLPADRGGVLWVALLPATLAMGASLPFALEALARRNGSPQKAYAFQLAGATLGSLGTTFGSIDALGVAGSQYLAATLSTLCALFGFWLRDPHMAPAPSPSFSSPPGES
jgi:spermidine synthase